MEHCIVQDNNIASVAFEAPNRPGELNPVGIMQTLFRRGGLYEYEGVTFDEFTAILNPEREDETIGKAFDRIIKRGGKRYRKLEAIGVKLDEFSAMESRRKVISISEADHSDVEVSVQEVEQVKQKSTELTVQAQAIQVIDPATQAAASEILLVIASMRREIADTFGPMKTAAHQAHKVICDQERMVDAPLAQAETTLKSRIGGFVQEQRRLAAAEEARQREIARIEAERIAAEATVEQALDQAIDLEARGHTEAAAAVLASPAPVPARYIAPAPVAPAVAQVKGVGTRFDWDFRILDINQIPREYLLVNESAIRALGKTTQGRAKIAGVEFFEKPVVSSSRGR